MELNVVSLLVGAFVGMAVFMFVLLLVVVIAMRLLKKVKPEPPDEEFVSDPQDTPLAFAPTNAVFVPREGAVETLEATGQTIQSAHEMRAALYEGLADLRAKRKEQLILDTFEKETENDDR